MAFDSRERKLFDRDVSHREKPRGRGIEVLPSIERERGFDVMHMSRPALPGGPQGEDAFRVLIKRPGKWNHREPVGGGPDDEYTKRTHQIRNYAGILAHLGLQINARLALTESSLITGTILTPAVKIVAPILAGYSASRLLSAVSVLRSGHLISGGLGVVTSGASLLAGVVITGIALTGNPPAVIGAVGFWGGMYIGTQKAKK